MPRFSPHFTSARASSSRASMRTSTGKNVRLKNGSLDSMAYAPRVSLVSPSRRVSGRRSSRPPARSTKSTWRSPWSSMAS